MRRAILLATVAIAGCSNPAPMNVATPGKIRQALTSVRELEAIASLVAPGGTPSEGVALRRSEDGRSFTGFVPADPGEYTLEITFTGMYQDSDMRLFLGRWTSDGFVVTRGNAIPATFSRPVDPVGRDGDDSDVDDDGVPNLDELIAQSSPLTNDSDGDGVVDAEDCNPADPARTARVTTGGSIFDCDADGYRRMDIAGAEGDDCDDGNPATNPAATDLCTDVVDSDCNQTTCPLADGMPPTIDGLLPEDGGLIGCFGQISANFTDVTGITSAYVQFPETPYEGNRPRSLLMSSTGNGDEWKSQVLADAFHLAPLPTSPERVRILATDGAGNTAQTDHDLTFSFVIPTATMTVLDESGSTRRVRVQSTVMHGMPRVRLMAGVEKEIGFEGPNAIEVGVLTGTDVTFNVTEAQLGASRYMIFAIVEDAIGNRLGPNLIGDLYSVTPNAYFPCVPTEVPYPAALLSFGALSRRAYKMRELLSIALDIQQVNDPTAVLTHIGAFSVSSGGTVNFNSTTDYLARWTFGFYNSTTRDHLEVAFYSAAYGGAFPVITLDAGNQSSTEPLENVMDLIDSDRAAQLYGEAMNCGQLGGDTSDSITYTNVNGSDAVSVNSEFGIAQFSAVEPGTLIYNGCQ